MTVKECRDLFLQHMGERTVNGSPINDQDLIATFKTLCYPAMLYVSAEYPKKVLADIDRDTAKNGWTKPADLVSIVATYNSYGTPVGYYEKGDKFYFDTTCQIEYAHSPSVPDLSADTTALDMESRAAQLVPLKVAIDASLARPEYAYKVAFLSEQYNSMAQAMLPDDTPTFRRVYSI